MFDDSLRPQDGQDLPVSFGQQQLWFLEQLAPGKPTYNIAVVHDITGPLQVAALRQAVDRTVARHEALRATFHDHEGTPFQRISPPSHAGLEVEDLTGLDPEHREAAAQEATAREARIPFDLAAGPLYRFRLYRLADDRHLLSIVIHHIICDGWSIGIISATLSAAYRALIAEGEPATDEAAPGYREAVAAQHAAHASGEFEPHLDYWVKRLVGLPTLELPTDRPRPALAGHRGNGYAVTYPDDLATGVRRLAAERRASPSMVLTSAVAVVLSRYSRQVDLPVGTTTLGRLEPELERVVGMFVNTVVLRLDTSGDHLTFGELVERTRDTMLEAYDHQSVPFQQVVDRVATHDPSRNPLFQVCVQTLEEATGGGWLDLAGTTVHRVDQAVEQSRFDLSLTFSDTAGGLGLEIEYSTELFDRDRIARLAEHVARVLAAAIHDPGATVHSIDLLSDQERNALLAAGVGPHDELPAVPVHRLVLDRAAERPDDVAAMFEGGTLTYAELDYRSDLLARHLRALGVGHEDLVGVALDRGLHVPVALLGVLRAGAAFVVVDPEHPVNRVEYILQDAGAQVLITSADLVGRMPEPAGRSYVCLDADWPALVERHGGATDPLPEVATPDSLVYALYTSGSTGKPKGVLIEHRALISYLASFVEMFGLGPGDRMLQFASLTFDLSQAEIFSALTSGAALVFATKDTLMSPDTLPKLLRHDRVTYLGAPPAMLAMLEAEPYPDLRNVLVGGEVCPPELVNRWNLPGRTFVNGYGPTEATIGATMCRVARRTWHSSPPIGRPLQHRRLYVVDPLDQLVPLGVPGELLIGGDEGLARGYLKRPDLTASRFVADPFVPDGRVYRSGDLVRWNADGELEFLGRVDNQVKLRGLRIELEEIETVLSAHPAVTQAAVVLREDTPGQQLLAAYITLSGAEVPPVPELRRHLAESLPAYMVPTAWTVLNALPLSVAGKIDRRALPVPTMITDSEREITPPRTAAERHVATAIAEVLALPDGTVGAEEDFFELGGNSLQAMRVMSRLNRVFGTRLGVRVLYGNPRVEDFARELQAHAVQPVAAEPVGTARPAPPVTDVDRIAAIFAQVLPPSSRRVAGTDSLFELGGTEEHSLAVLDAIDDGLGVRLSPRDLFSPEVLAAAVRSRRTRTADPAGNVTRHWSPVVPLPGAGGGDEPPLFCLPGVSGSASSYLALARALRSPHPLVGLEAPGLDPGTRPLESVPALAAVFADGIRARRPRGPYLLLGWSMGGLVALEAARLLTAAGGQVPLVAVLDTQLPDGNPVPADRDLIARFVEDLAAELGRPAPALDGLVDTDPTGSAELLALLRADLLPADLTDDQVRRRLAVFLAHSRATYAYRTREPLTGRLVVLATAGARTPAQEWAPVAAQVEMVTVPGDHYSIWSPDHLGALARTVTGLLDRERGRA